MEIGASRIRSEKSGKDYFLLIFGTFFGSVVLGGFFGFSLLNTNAILAYFILGFLVGIPALILLISVLIVLLSL